MMSTQKYFIAARVALAIEKETRIKLRDFAVKSHDRELVTCRVVFCYLCKQSGLNSYEITGILGKDRTSYYHMMKSYSDCMETDKDFRAMVGRIEKMIETK